MSNAGDRRRARGFVVFVKEFSRHTPSGRVVLGFCDWRDRLNTVGDGGFASRAAISECSSSIHLVHFTFVLCYTTDIGRRDMFG